MNPAKIKQWACEAELLANAEANFLYDRPTWDAARDKHFATLARADMQERCAQLANKQGTSSGQRIAEAIRALEGQLA